MKKKTQPFVHANAELDGGASPSLCAAKEASNENWLYSRLRPSLHKQFRWPDRSRGFDLLGIQSAHTSLLSLSLSLAITKAHRRSRTQEALRERSHTE
jgi:hypothetical protein